MMKREIFFRGQTRRKGQKVWMDGSPVDGNWVYGGVCHGTGDFSIIYGNLDEERERPTEKWVVYTDTVGQYTGLTDKNGKRIFEGDIVQDGYLFGKVVFATAQDGFDGMAGFMVDDINDGLQNYNGFWHEVEVIGNIHDNPELLGGEEGG